MFTNFTTSCSLKQYLLIISSTKKVGSSTVRALRAYITSCFNIKVPKRIKRIKTTQHAKPQHRKPGLSEEKNIRMVTNRVFRVAH